MLKLPFEQGDVPVLVGEAADRLEATLDFLDAVSVGTKPHFSYASVILETHARELRKVVREIRSLAVRAEFPKSIDEP